MLPHGSERSAADCEGDGEGDKVVLSRVTVTDSSQIDPDAAAAIAEVNQGANGSLRVKLHDMPSALDTQTSDGSRDALYQQDARMRAREYTGYRHVAACSTCDARSICDGFYSEYVELFGEQEARPILLGGPVSDPRHFSKHQQKKIHPEDLRWLKAGGE